MPDIFDQISPTSSDSSDIFDQAVSQRQAGAPTDAQKQQAAGMAQQMSPGLYAPPAAPQRSFLSNMARGVVQNYAGLGAGLEDAGALAAHAVGWKGGEQAMMQAAQNTQNYQPDPGSVGGLIGNIAGEVPKTLASGAGRAVDAVNAGLQAYNADESQGGVSGWDEAAHVAGTMATQALTNKVFSGTSGAAEGAEKAIANQIAPQAERFLSADAAQTATKYGAKALVGAGAQGLGNTVNNALYGQPLTQGLGTALAVGGAVPVLHEGITEALGQTAAPEGTPQPEAAPAAKPEESIDDIFSKAAFTDVEGKPAPIPASAAADTEAELKARQQAKETEGPSPDTRAPEGAETQSDPETDKRIAEGMAKPDETPQRRSGERDFTPDEDRELIKNAVTDPNAFGKRAGDWQQMSDEGKTLLQKLREQKIAKDAETNFGQQADENQPAQTESPSLYRNPMNKTGAVALPTHEDLTGPGSVYGEEIKPKLDKLVSGSGSIFSGLKNMFPVETGAGHEETQGIFRQRLSENTNNQQRAQVAFKEAGTAFDKMPVEDQHEFQRAMYDNAKQPTPELQSIADKMYEDTNEGRKALIALGHDAANQWDEQKWNMLWTKDPNASRDLLQKMNVPGKVEGRGSFLKKQKLGEFEEGLQKGLIPKFSNPVDMFLATKAERGKYIAGVNAMDDMHKAGIVQKIGPNDDVPAGWSEVPRAAAGPLKKITGWKPGDETRYIAPDGANRIMDNLTKPSLFSKGAAGTIYRAAMAVNNTITQSMLGLSMFHVKKVSQELIALNTARAMGEGSPKALTEGGPFRAINRGADIQKTMLGLKQAASPEQARAIDLMVKSGFTAKSDSSYETQWRDRATKAWRDGGLQGILRAGLKALPAANEKMMQDGVFGYVQHAKLSVGMDMMQDAMKRLGPNATDAEVLKEGRKISDHVDNVLGLMNRDNLFWNRTARDLATLSTLSVGWNYGSLRALAGGLKDTGPLVKNLVQGKGTGGLDLKRISYLASTAALTGLTGAVTTYLTTGKAPQHLMDYLHPPTGQKNADGNAARFDTGFYSDDWFNFMHHPIDTVEAKGSPLLHAAGALLSNKDAGVSIRQSDDAWYQQAAQVAKYLGKQAEPLSVKQLVDTIEGGGKKSLTDKLLPFAGVKNAPRSFSQSDAEKQAYDLLSQHDEVGGRTQAQADRSQAINRLATDMRDKVPGVVREFQKQVKAGALEPSDFKLISKKAEEPQGLPGLVRDDRLQPADLMRIWDKATADERKQISWVVRGRIGRSTSTPLEQKRQYLHQITEDMQ